MARYTAGQKTGLGTTLLPYAAVIGAAGSGGRMREVGAFNTTSTACDIKLVRLTTAGTPGSTITAEKYDGNSAANACLAKGLYTSTGPTLTDLGYRASLGAAIGSGVIWTFGDSGLVIPLGVANGIGVVVENGTGQLLQLYFTWDE